MIKFNSEIFKYSCWKAKLYTLIIIVAGCGGTSISQQHKNKLSNSSNPTHQKITPEAIEEKDPCISKTWDVCTRQAIELQQQKKWTEAIEKFTLSCEHNNAEGCYRAGAFYEAKSPGMYDMAKSVSFYKKACDANHAIACSNLGLISESGDKEYRDIKLAAKLYQKSCDLEFMKGCDNMAYLYKEGIGVEKNEERAFQLYLMACNKGAGLSCANVAFFYQNGIVVSRSFRLAAQYYERSCRMEMTQMCDRPAQFIPYILDNLKSSSSNPESAILSDDVDPASKLDWLSLEAQIMSYAGNRMGALRQLEKAYKLIISKYGDHNSQTFYIARLFAEELLFQNRLADARNVLDAVTRGINSETHDLPIGLNLVLALVKLSKIYEKLDNTLAAKNNLSTALIFEETLLGNGREDLAMGYNDLGLICRKLNDFKCAAKAFDKAFHIQQSISGDDNSKTQTYANNYADAILFLGKTKDAAAIFENVRDYRLQHLGKDDPLLAQSYNNLAYTSASSGDITSALKYQNQSYDILYSILLDRLIGNGGYNGKSNQKQNVDDSYLYRQMFGDLSARVSMDLLSNHGNSETRFNAVEAAINSFGVMSLAHTLAFRSLRNSSDNYTREIMTTILSLRKKYANRHMQSVSTRENLFNTALQIKNLETRIEQLEKEVLLEGDSDIDSMFPLYEEDLRQQLDPDTAFVQYILFMPIKFNAKTLSERFGEIHIAAYVLDNKGNTDAADLGPVLEIIKKTNEITTETAGEKNSIKALNQLYKTLVYPIEKGLEGKSRIVIVPATSLEGIPFDALVDNNGKFLIEKYSFRYLAGAYELFSTSSAKIYPNANALKKSIVVADPSFSSPHKDGNSTRATDSPLQFSPLPGTQIEGEQIASILQIPKKNLLTKDRATESAIKKLSSPLILHIATHGYFLPRLSTPSGLSAALRNVNYSLQAQQVDDFEDALIRSGIALSSANFQGYDKYENDGLLTAIEFQGLDLSKTEIVVLSACSTGKGDIEMNEGLSGIRAAMMKSGAKSRVFALWDISDCGTMLFMTHWYSLLIQGMDRNEALRQTKLAMLHGEISGQAECSSRGIKLKVTQTNKNYSHPYYWSAFQLEGAAGPLIKK